MTTVITVAIAFVISATVTTTPKIKPLMSVLLRPSVVMSSESLMQLPSETDRHSRCRLRRRFTLSQTGRIECGHTTRQQIREYQAIYGSRTRWDDYRNNNYTKPHMLLIVFKYGHKGTDRQTNVSRMRAWQRNWQENKWKPQKALMKIIIRWLVIQHHPMWAKSRTDLPIANYIIISITIVIVMDIIRVPLEQDTRTNAKNNNKNTYFALRSILLFYFSMSLIKCKKTTTSSSSSQDTLSCI